MTQASQHTFQVLGTMSGTSLDGLDLTISQFQFDLVSKTWKGQIERFQSISLPVHWQSRFKELNRASAERWHQLQVEWTHWCADEIMKFTDLKDLDLVVFPGQTIFHRPDEGWTGQLGHGGQLHAFLGATVPVVSDLRSLDVALGGQGAPLVPMADELLYADFDACLNLGGFANMSKNSEGSSLRVAWDIGPCNLVLNEFAALKELPFDKDGALARAGRVIPELWNQWMALEYHLKSGPKSLGVEWLELVFWPAAAAWHPTSGHSAADLSSTAAHYIASIIRAELGGCHALATGGGTHHVFLMELLQAAAHEYLTGEPVVLTIPNSDVVNGKEAHAFGLLGLMRVLEQNNVHSSITGSRLSHCGGAIWGILNSKFHRS